MMDDKNKLVVVTSVGSEEMALEIAQELVEGRTAACVNLIPSVRSVYRWKGKVCDDRESLLIIKTRKDRLDDVKETIFGIIDYECPEVIAFDIVDGSEQFLAWVDACLDSTGGEETDEE